VAGEENLIPFSERTKEEARELGRRGGKASGAARRRKRSLKEAADLYLSLPVEDKRRWNKLSRRYLDAEDIDNQMAMVVSLWDGAMAGDARSAKVLIDLLGKDSEEDSNAAQLTMDAELEEFSQ
jgi:hypothetical protein